MTNIIESFQKQVLLTPDRDAVCFKEQKLTYRELDDLSDKFSNFIKITHEVKKGDIVPILLDRSEKVIVSILAVLKSGAGYVILSETYPKDRIDFIRKLTKSKISIDDKLFGEFKESNNLVTGDISKNTSSTDCAYLVFTSGTTGIPKGVIHTHESVLSHINRYSKYLNLDHDEPLNVLLIVNFIFFSINYSNF